MIYPEWRNPKTAVAHTKVEGGEFWRRPPSDGELFHSVFYADGWAWDTELSIQEINNGWRCHAYEGL